MPGVFFIQIIFMKEIILVLSCVIIFQACKTTKTAMPPPATDSLPVSVENVKPSPSNMLDTSWELQSQFGSQLDTKYVPQLIINSTGKKFYGSKG